MLYRARCDDGPIWVKYSLFAVNLLVGVSFILQYIRLVVLLVAHLADK